MIHKIIVIDQRTTIGQVLFDDATVALETDLLTGFISALSAFAECLGEKSVEFKGADLGDYRFSLISRDHLTYAVFQDLFDNEPFARVALKEIIDIYHNEIMLLNLSIDQIRKEIPSEVRKLIETEFFPVEILRNINLQIEELLDTNTVTFDLMFLSSINNGIVKVWRRPIDPTIMKQFLDIISKIPLEMNWLAEGKASNYGIGGFLNDNDLEAWMIKRVSTTNYFIAGRAIAKCEQTHDGFSTKMSAIMEDISEMIERALEKEWTKMANIKS